MNKAAGPSRRTLPPDLNAGIAAELVVSPGAVEKHVAGIFAKLGLPPPTATTGGPNLRYLGA